MTTDRDDASVRRYREASAALDERPSAATRAAVLGAAARHVGARPQTVGAPRAVRRTRWPLAAAAVVLLSTLAVMMATRTEQEMPTFTAPAERASEPLAVAPAPSTAATATVESAPPAPSAPVVEAPAAIAKRSATPGAREERAAAPAAPTARMDAQRADAATAATPPAEPSPEVASAERRQAFPAAPTSTPSAAPRARSAPAPAAAGATRAPEIGAAAKPEASTADRATAREAVPEQHGAQGPQSASPVDAAREFEGSAPAWLERIVKLRGEGLHAEADAELKRFRERYPDARVPPAALPIGAVPATR